MDMTTTTHIASINTDLGDATGDFAADYDLDKARELYAQAIQDAVTEIAGPGIHVGAHEVYADLDAAAAARAIDWARLEHNGEPLVDPVDGVTAILEQCERP